LLGADGEGDGQDGGHGNGDTTDQEDEDVVKAISVRITVGSVEDENLENDKDTDGDETEGADLGENLLQMSGGVVVLAYQGCCASEEGVGTGGDDDTLCFSLFTG